MTIKRINPPSLFNSLQYGFSQAVETTGTRQLFLSGQVGVDHTEVTVAGGSLSDVVMLRIYIRAGADSHDEQTAIADVLKEKFADDAPASSWVIVSGLSLPEWLIEIEAHAVLP